MIFLPEPAYCEHDGCQAEAKDVIHCVITSWVANEPDQHYHYCGEHASVNGFCYLCGWFALGASERFEFGPYKGLCDNCRDEVRANEESEDDEFDDDPYDDTNEDDDADFDRLFGEDFFDDDDDDCDDFDDDDF